MSIALYARLPRIEPRDEPLHDHPETAGQGEDERGGDIFHDAPLGCAEQTGKTHECHGQDSGDEEGHGGAP